MRPSARPRPLCELIEELYAATGDEAALGHVLERVAALLRGEVAAIHEYDLAARRGRAVVAAGLEPDRAAAYESYYSKVSPWMRQGRDQIRPGSVIVSHELFPESELPGTEYHADFLVPLGVFHSIGAVTALEREVMSTVTVLRPRCVGRYEAGERAVMRSLLPHFQAVLRLHRRVAAVAAERDAALRALDLLADGVAVLDDRGRVVTVNRAGRELLERREGLSLVGERLAPAAPGEARRLAGLIADALAAPGLAGRSPGGEMTVSRPGEARPLTLLVSSLPGAAGGSAPGPRAVVFLTDPCRHGEPPEEALTRLWGLTRAEARVALLVVRGASLEEAARALGVGRETVRTHLKRAFVKTGTSRQAGLVSAVSAALPRLLDG